LDPLGRHFTTLSLTALAVGLGLGILLHGSEASWVGILDRSLGTVGHLWVTALQLTVVPLIFTQLATAVLGTERLGILGARTIGVFFIMLVAAGAFAFLVASPLVALYRVEPEVVAGLRDTVSFGNGTGGGAGAVSGMLRWIPDWILQFFLGKNPIPLLFSALAVSLGGRRLPEPSRESLRSIMERGSNATLRLVGWILWLTPLGVLALTFGLAQSAGGGALRLLISFVLIISSTTLLFAFLFYPVTAVLGRIPIRRFAWGMAPAQVVAASTRSSLAALPALVEGARDRLHLPLGATGFVIPFAVSTVKVSRMTTTMTTLLFLAHVFELPLGPGTILVFFGTVAILSFIVAGLPGRGPEASLFPAYVAAGIPLEGVVILEAVDAIPDVFKTVLNVTSIMSAAAIVDPPARSREP